MSDQRLIQICIEILEAKKKRGYSVDALITELNQLRNGRQLDKQGSQQTSKRTPKGYWNKEGSQHPKGET